ncbi:hypothetical protein [Sporosarcina beigongshangi]|uniref:hypothetical protein n=1 Tax=Sporosarcina beigongshangi TaxID=2782538 RepID=UPI0019395CD6|nr:hypothetical protein [Sporosarcina beigongshangi]
MIVYTNMYYYPSLKIYAERLRIASEENYQELWGYFSGRFGDEYDRISRSIGVPIRTRVYRLSRSHYKDQGHWWRIYLFSGKEAIIDTVSIVTLAVILLFYLL